MKTAINPVIRGYNSASVITKENDNSYWIANATAQYFPGIMIYHSTNLVNWEFIERPLNSLEFLDIKGAAPDTGIMAPELIFHDGLFYLVYTINHGNTPHCYVTTSKKPGVDPWSKPKFINASGIDQSLYFEDGKMYVLTNRVVDQLGYGGVYEKSPMRTFQGINIQEYDFEKGELIGMPVDIWKGTDHDITEGPHLYKRGEYYYLMTAEGGMCEKHTTSLARSKSMYGPYETAPNNPIQTARDIPDSAFQQVGHGSIVEDKLGNVWMISLGNRRIETEYGDDFPLGCETILARYRWTEDGWLEPHTGSPAPSKEIEMPWEVEPYVEFDENVTWKDIKSIDNLPIQFFMMREPITSDWARVTDEGLVLKGRNAPVSYWSQSSIHRLWQSFNFMFETEFEFNPIHEKQSAGIMQKYSEENQILFSVIRKYKNDKKALEVRGLHPGMGPKVYEEIEIPEETKSIAMRSTVQNGRFNFEYRLDGGEWKATKDDFSVGLISPNRSQWAYGSCIVGFFVTDAYRLREEATFKYTKYKEL